MTMKKISLIIGLLIAANILLAQGARTPVRQEAREEIEDYKERLNLSDDQTAEIREIKKKYRPQLQEVRSDSSLSRSDKMRSTADIYEKQDAEIAEVLTDEQNEEWKEIKAEVKANKDQRQEKRGQRRNGNG